MFRYLNYLLALALCLTLTSTAFSQEQVLAPAAVVADDVPTGAFAAIPDDAAMSVKAFRDEVAKSIVQEAEKSQTLSRGEKRKIARVMRGGWFNESRREAIITEVAKKLHAEQVIVVLPDGVQAAVDWDSVLSFIEKLLPLILQLVSLFGG